MNSVNIFTHYEQEENDFTNGFVSILSLSRIENPRILTMFLRNELELALNGKLDTFRVLKEIKGTPDAELRGKNCCVWLETKIVSGALDAKQIRRHLKALRNQPGKLRRLVLLTPDDSGSRYIQQFLSLDATRVLHLSWKRVYKFLERSINNEKKSIFSELVRQFLARVHATVFAQDLAGIILKIAFGDKSEVYEKRYLGEINAGKWTKWNTPRECKSLDGTGRKLMLYDRTRQGITAEAEIQKVKRTDSEPDYPWTNVFAPGTLHVFERPIPLSRIRLVRGFENFGVYRKDRSAYRNITHEQYRQLTTQRSESDAGRTSGCS